MVVKKAYGTIYGADLTSAEKKAMNLEIQRQMAEYIEKNELEMDAIVLWVLRKQFGFGPKRLKRFYKGLSESINDLCRRYQIEDSDSIWLCTKLLYIYGVDIAKWKEESENL